MHGEVGQSGGSDQKLVLRCIQEVVALKVLGCLLTLIYLQGEDCALKKLKST